MGTISDVLEGIRGYMAKSAHMGEQGRDMSSLENVKNLGKLLTMIRIYLFK
jgi:hypothetical protein